MQYVEIRWRRRALNKRQSQSQSGIKNIIVLLQREDCYTAFKSNVCTQRNT